MQPHSVERKMLRDVRECYGKSGGAVTDLRQISGSMKTWKVFRGVYMEGASEALSKRRVSLRIPDMRENVVCRITQHVCPLGSDC